MCKKQKNFTENEKKESLEKRGIWLVCIIINLCIIIIFIFIGRTCSNKAFVNQVSFAATVSSIILSVLAIIMSISGASKMDHEIQRLGDLREEINVAFDKIQRTYSEINTNVNTLTEMRLAEEGNIQWTTELENEKTNQ